MLPAYRIIKARTIVIVVLFTAIGLGGTLCHLRSRTDTPSLIRNQEGKAFAGDASCRSCHAAICQRQSSTAHSLDSRPATGESIRGSFDSGKNRYIYTPGMEVKLEQRNHRYFQAALINGKETRREAFDIVIGSGRKGQSYLYWDSGKLFQLPVSYYAAANSWCNSPGYRNDTILFNRRVPSYCLECHSTYVQAAYAGPAGQGDFFDPSQVIYGIGCERCHGPGAEHVAFHQSHPDVKTGYAITNVRHLGRQQRLDACALCHSGARIPLKPAFQFRTGDTLEHFSLPNYSDDRVARLDVHDNQYGLLTASKCFRLSQMDCSSCHNVHNDEVGSPALFSQRCMTCHNSATHTTCTLKPIAGLVLSANCIDCHMPALPSQKILLTLSGAVSPIHNLVRMHRVAIYPESTKAYLEKMKTQ